MGFKGFQGGSKAVSWGFKGVSRGFKGFQRGFKGFQGVSRFQDLFSLGSTASAYLQPWLIYRSEDLDGGWDRRLYSYLLVGETTC